MWYHYTTNNLVIYYTFTLIIPIISARNTYVSAIIHKCYGNMNKNIQSTYQLQGQNILGSKS